MPKLSYGAPHLQGGFTSPPKNVSPAGTRYRDLGDGRRHMATGMHGSEPAEDIVVDALRSTRYHVSPSRGDCRDACAIRSECGIWRCKLRDSRRMLYFCRSKQRWLRWELLLYQRRYCWWECRVVHVHVL